MPGDAHGRFGKLTTGVRFLTDRRKDVRGCRHSGKARRLIFATAEAEGKVLYPGAE